MPEDKEVNVETKPEGNEPESPDIPDGSQEQAVEADERDDTIKRLEAKLTEQATVNKTLQSSLEWANRKDTGIGKDEISEIEKLISEDPQEAMKRMVQYQKKMQVQSTQREYELMERSRQETAAFIEKNKYVEDLKGKDKDVAHYDRFLGASAREAMKEINPVTGKNYTWMEAINMVVDEFKKTRRDDPVVKAKATSSPAPNGARGEKGSSSKPPPPEPEKEETTADIVARENARLNKRRMLRG